MKRFAYNQLLEWKKMDNSQLLLIGGVPRVGKTGLILQFAKTEFKKYLYYETKSSLIKLQKDVEELESGSLIILDNLNGDKDTLFEVKQLSLKFDNIYFILIDSFAKVARGESRRIQLNYLIIYPLTFEEFLINVNYDLFCKLASINNILDLDKEFNDNILKYFHDYLFVGGMPSVVELYINSGLVYEEIRENQALVFNEILSRIDKFYKTTESKNLIKILRLIFPTLVRENRKFKLSDISISKRFTTFKSYFDILEKLNLVYITRQLKNNINDIDQKSMNIFLFDIGLLGFLGDVPHSLYNSYLLLNQITVGLLQNFVANELYSTTNKKVFFWNHNMAKIEFVLVNDDYILPIEVKNDLSGKLKSLNTFSSKFDISKKIRLNLSSPEKRADVNIYPIYLIKNLYRKFIS
ncbi:ATP-binding protein [Thiospirochaeta perfilievii]|uniref:ATP-binding protein n=1 Tax=Thiospirochaeta perfilievii TaxID=252967 RepID=A0A5C1QDH6_9SPIO|nr:DUF4143 domain-containing protein [Thiospirochaeta perfilievii]QEN06123.1 ATP-binding protein [Thiospirochaeta perfilievii]